MSRKLFPALVVLALGILACRLPISLLPSTTITPGPTMTDKIDVPTPANTTQPVDLRLAFGAGTLKVHPGARTLVSGTAVYNISDFKPTVTVNASSVRIEQGEWKLTGVPNISNIKNDWDLSLGSQAINLSIEGGAYHAEYDLGGLALTRLSVKDGASEVKMNFASPNPAELSLLYYETGVSDVSLMGLGNANFNSLVFKSGAGNYRLDFSGTLRQNGNVDIETGVSNMTLVIPSGIPVQLTVDGGLSNVSYGSGWSKSGDLYSQAGSGPQLIIVVHIGAGNLSIMN